MKNFYQITIIVLIFITCNASQVSYMSKNTDPSLNKSEYYKLGFPKHIKTHKDVIQYIESLQKLKQDDKSKLPRYNSKKSAIIFNLLAYNKELFKMKIDNLEDYESLSKIYTAYFANLAYSHISDIYFLSTSKKVKYYNESILASSSEVNANICIYEQNKKLVKIDEKTREEMIAHLNQIMSEFISKFQLFRSNAMLNGDTTNIVSNDIVEYEKRILALKGNLLTN